ncbi:nuclear transport factor 2 family protein [Sphingobium terrigena]|uniref:Nuclear transport factor 2 family protein n=1 Tax=Sphingobium terrigena TaxID=2304063 RepID=A0A418YPN4_9SPHN|nr:nuclear transport factor 2 family protein [Sphingobium terrigena]RJG53298.1 nuclear transport factor 2 family protein [Sphingobium terrigena]
MAQIDIAALARDVAYLMDRRAIEDCVHRHARGHDRFDVDLLTAAYHPDGIDEHGAAAINKGTDYAEWANAIHAAGSQLHLHNITTHTCDIDGTVAHAESYVIVGLLNPDGKSVRLINGRYVDRLEKRDGAWKIALRRCTVDLLIAGDASILEMPQFKAGGYIKGQRDGSDVSYQRPLSLDLPASRW